MQELDLSYNTDLGRYVENEEGLTDEGLRDLENLIEAHRVMVRQGILCLHQRGLSYLNLSECGFGLVLTHKMFLDVFEHFGNPYSGPGIRKLVFGVEDWQAQWILDELLEVKICEWAPEIGCVGRLQKLPYEQRLLHFYRRPVVPRRPQPKPEKALEPAQAGVAEAREAAEE